MPHNSHISHTIKLWISYSLIYNMRYISDHYVEQCKSIYHVYDIWIFLCSYINDFMLNVGWSQRSGYTMNTLVYCIPLTGVVLTQNRREHWSNLKQWPTATLRSDADTVGRHLLNCVGFCLSGLLLTDQAHTHCTLHSSVELTIYTVSQKNVTTCCTITLTISIQL